MPRKPKQPQPDAPVVSASAAPLVTPEETPAVSPVVAAPQPAGPRIEFIGEGADQITFTPHPKATRIQVFASGQIVETF